MDLNKLRTHVFEKTGIKIDTNDPIFALVALNEAVLAECVDQQTLSLHNTAERLAQHTVQLVEAGDRAKKLLLQLGQTVEDPVFAPTIGKAAETSAKEKSPHWRWLAATGGISLLSSLLVVVGQTALGYPHLSSPPAMVVTPRATLTPEQVLLIQDGEKYARMWPKLDPKTQAKIQALSE